MNKILFIVNVDWFFLSHRLPIALSMKEKGFEIHIACKYTSESRLFKNLGFFTHNLNIDRASTNFFSSARNLFEIYCLLKKINPKIVHFITIKPIIFGGLALHFLREKPSAVFSISGLGHIFIAKGIKARVKRIIVLFLYCLSLMHKKIAIIFQNNDDKRLILRNTKIKLSKTFLVPGSGIKLKNYIKTKFPRIPVILFPARLLKSKGILEFVECAKILNCKYRFVIVGKIDQDNPDSISKATLNTWRQSGLIEYWGFSTNMSETFSKCSIVVLPSYREGFPKVLMEAAACGRPVITTDVPGCRDAIIKNKTGLLVPVRNHIAIAKSIKSLMSNKSLLKRMSIASRQLAENKFPVEKVIKSHNMIYSKLL